MDNTYKVWCVKRYLQPNEVSLCPDGLVLWQDKDDEGFYFVDRQLEAIICQPVGVKDKNGLRLYSGDIIQSSNGKMYICQYECYLCAWEAWDFKAWAEGYYDAYIPLHEVGSIYPEDCTPPCTPEPKFADVVRIGSLHETPELCPEVFDERLK